MEENRKMSRAQKRRNAKRKKEEEAKKAAAAAAAASAAPKAPTEKAVPTQKKLTPPKASPTAEAKTEAPKSKFAEVKVSSDSSENEDESRRPLRAEELCARMPLGKSGKSTQLVSNTFQLNFIPTQVFRYVVEFEPEIPPERIKQRRIVLGKFRDEVKKVYGENFFDGTTLLSLSRAGNTNLGPKEGFSIHIRYIKAIDTTDKNVQEVNTITNVISKKLLRRLGMILIGRSYFYPQPKALNVRWHQSTPPNERHRLRLYTGFNCSVQPCMMGNLMTIDLVSRVVQELSVRNIMNKLMEDVKRAGKGRDDYQNAANNMLIGSTVLCNYNNRPWRIDELDFTKTMASTFPIDAPQPRRDGSARDRGRLGDRTGDISFRDYFCLRYPEIEEGKRLPPANHPACNIPGLLVNKPRRAGTTKKDTILLPELCFLTGLDDKMRSNQSLMKALNQETRLPPSRRVNAIQDLIRRMLSKTEEVDRKEGKLCVELGSQPIEITGRVLTDVAVSMPRGRPKTLGDNKSFSNDIRSCGFFDGRANVGNWACVFPEHERRCAQQVVQTMKQLAGQQGASLGNTDVAEVPARSTKDSKAWINAINQVSRKKPAFILFMNPGADSFVYSVVKNACSVQTAIVSQVMDSTKLQQNTKMLKPICGNTLKQILAKLGFQNWRIDIAKYLPPAEAKSTMFVGVDVSHDKLLKGVYGASRGRRSTVGFTASRNPSYHAYNSYISYQDPDTEFITEAKRLMSSALNDYYAENKRHPTSVCIYRDGVGDSQLTTFVRQEINLYKEAFEALNLNIKLTVIVVQKRVNLRLFARCPLNARQAQRCPIENRCNGRDMYHSPMAGTVVDNVITSEMMSDFYLVPSIAPPGATARPTRFVVMIDDMELATNPDALQNMTNNMCYQYFNWPGPIRVPACVMYAHKAAYLFGKHVTGNVHKALAKNLFYL
jgi:aubergine-like protein